jgi:hypothetical protein
MVNVLLAMDNLNAWASSSTESLFQGSVAQSWRGSSSNSNSGDNDSIGPVAKPGCHMPNHVNNKNNNSVPVITTGQFIFLPTVPATSFRSLKAEAEASHQTAAPNGASASLSLPIGKMVRPIDFIPAN